MNPILVVGSVALDSVSTPEGESVEALGGSAVYFSLAARHFAPVRVVGVVGEDFPAGHRAMLAGLGIDCSGLKTRPGRTFRWRGRYEGRLNCAQTLETQLNVFESFAPELSEQHKESPVVFLANIDPDLQWEVLSQMRAPRLVAADTMNFWIGSKKAQIKELLARVDLFFVNEDEARELTGEANNVRAARTLLSWGPSAIVVKKGEHGALLAAGGRVYPFPAFPLAAVQDPTGAGDSFAGGVLGYLAAQLEPARGGEPLRHALVYGAALASINCEGFSTARLEAAGRDGVEERRREYLELLPLRDGVPDPA